MDEIYQVYSGRWLIATFKFNTATFVYISIKGVYNIVKLEIELISCTKSIGNRILFNIVNIKDFMCP